MGWVPFRYGISGPVKLVNGATMQALGNYRAGTMLFLGLGTALGSPMVVEGTVVPMDWRTCLLGTYEDYLGIRGINRLGKAKW